LDAAQLLEGQQSMRIKHLLEGLNAQQRSVPQLPAQARAKHISVLGAKTDPQHPFAGYMVGAGESAEPGKKSIGPDRNDPYEQGWRTGHRRGQDDNACPYRPGTPEHAQWMDGYEEAQAQPNHYNEGRAGVDDTDTVGFSVNTEAAYTAVMKHFNDVIEHDETSGVMYAPARVWPQIEMVAFDADGEGAMRDEGIEEEQLDEKCWDGYEKKGMKNMFGKRVPNCVKNEGEERNEMDTPAVQAALARMAERHKGEKWSKEQLAALGKRIAARGKKPVKEDDVADFLARGGKITQVKPNRGPRNPGLSLGSRHIGGGGDGARASRTGRGSKPQGKPVVAVESDVDEGWKSKLAGAALAGAAAFGGGGAQAQTTAPTGVNATGTNAAVVQSLVNPVAQQRFAKMHADTTAKLSDPRYTHNPDALAQHQAAPQQQHAEMLQNIKNIEHWDNPYRIIQMAMNMAGVTPQEVLQNLPKGYKLPTTEPKGTFVPKDLSKLNVREDVTKEDIITKLKARLGDYLSDLSKEIKQDPDLIDKLAAKAPGDQMGPPVKTVTTDDGHQIQIHGNEDDGFRISIKNKSAATRFKNLDEAVMACEMYCAQRRAQTESADYVDEAGKDACYNKVKSRYKIWPSAYASGALVQCRKAGADNWGNKSKK
jgi:hypothetical protein